MLGWFEFHQPMKRHCCHTRRCNNKLADNIKDPLWYNRWNYWFFWRGFGSFGLARNNVTKEFLRICCAVEEECTNTKDEPMFQMKEQREQRLLIQRKQLKATCDKPEPCVPGWRSVHLVAPCKVTAFTQQMVAMPPPRSCPAQCAGAMMGLSLHSYAPSYLSFLFSTGTCSFYAWSAFHCYTLNLGLLHPKRCSACNRIPDKAVQDRWTGDLMNGRMVLKWTEQKYFRHIPPGTSIKKLFRTSHNAQRSSGFQKSIMMFFSLLFTKTFSWSGKPNNPTAPSAHLPVLAFAFTTKSCMSRSEPGTVTLIRWPSFAASTGCWLNWTFLRFFTNSDKRPFFVPY